MDEGEAVAEELESATLAPGLYIVATPIGNLRDITLRALDTLRAADLVLAEDTRVTRKLFARYDIKRPLSRYDEHNAAAIQPALLKRLGQGEAIALVSDAGTPSVSDPGQRLAVAAIAAGYAVYPVPGPSAVLAGLVASGLPTERVLFIGFLPPRRAARLKALVEVKNVRATLVIFEAPQRLHAALTDIAEIFGPRPAAVARELTKRFEETRRGSLPELAEAYAQSAPRGEIVIVIAPPAEDEATIPVDLDSTIKSALANGSLRTAVDQIAADSGLPRRVVYERALALKEED